MSPPNKDVGIVAKVDKTERKFETRKVISQMG